ncbi:type IV inositol polyphosphate 5-phosphatase 3 isoform X2 [Euphorbia lathyris]|uniref:type IV inositol polyphosphate 5-phosphatase 3 isoform X2 n=1 Tax=Euphorbia lathyris TaxID=212925 RepID=UPI0033144D46
MQKKEHEVSLLQATTGEINWQRKSWVETCCCLGCSCLQLFWPRVVMRKLLNINTKHSDYSADSDSDGDNDSVASDTQESSEWPKESRFGNNRAEDPTNDGFPKVRSRRRKSETFRQQYINTKELRICVCTWNVGGKLPPDDLDIDDWIDRDDPADIYVFGLQEIVPLNPGNIFGAEDSRPVPMWENIIRETLEVIRPTRTKVKCHSDPPSPSKFKPPADFPSIEEEILLESDSDIGDEIHPINEEFDCSDLDENFQGMGDMHMDSCTAVDEISELGIPAGKDFRRQFSSAKRLDRSNCLLTEDSIEDVEVTVGQNSGKLTRMLSSTERIGLSWPEPPLDLLPKHVLQRPKSFKSIKSFKSSKSCVVESSLKNYSSFKSVANELQSGLALLAEFDLEALLNRKRRSAYIRIVSKQMVGIFITIWVRRSLRKHIQNLKVSTVGVGVMGYIGNKGAISVSMSVYQTLFCFICTHLTSGEKDGDELKRNADVHEIHKRTHFNPLSGVGLPRGILDHERIIWLGDLNYRINLSYEKTRELIARKEWSNLLERDQLVRELRKGRAFDGWVEGRINFAPTYKYELNSEKYYGQDPKAGRRVPAWCDRILSYGKGMKLLKYRRTELKLSDHRPVTATYMAEVEVFCPRRLQRALTYTDAEIENGEVLDDDIDIGIGYMTFEEDAAGPWNR